MKRGQWHDDGHTVPSPETCAVVVHGVVVEDRRYRHAAGARNLKHRDGYQWTCHDQSPTRREITDG